MRGAGKLKLACSWLARLRGLLFRSPAWLGADGMLLIAPCGSIHTYGMRHPIDAAFVDARGRVVHVEYAFPPGKKLTCGGAVAVLERFSDECYEQPRAGSDFPALGDELGAFVWDRGYPGVSMFYLPSFLG